LSPPLSQSSVELSEESAIVESMESNELITEKHLLAIRQRSWMAPLESGFALHNKHEQKHCSF